MSASDDALILYKLMVLYMLNKVDFPLTNSQISEFILGRSYTNYFSLQEAISSLLENELITSRQLYNNSYYSITEEGEETLSFFGSRIQASIKEDIDAYFIAQKIHLRNENDVLVDYYQAHGDSYVVNCEIRDKRETLASLSLTVTDEEEAIAICDNLREKNEAIYESLIQNLMIRS